jgi:branched-chain amino acid transport system ATP-binding protein
MAARDGEAAVITATNTTAHAAASLDIRGVTKRFGGLVAVDDLSMQAGSHRINTLIGPNGSGKSTVLNLVTGVYPLSAGRIAFAGQQVSGLSPHTITAQGIARTFQSIVPFEGLTALENVMVAQYCRTSAGLAAIALRTPAFKKEEARIRARAREALAFVGLADKADRDPRALPYGHRRLLEIARALVTEPKLLLLDEASAGMNPSEIQALKDLIRRIADQGIVVLAIEHNMNLVMELSEWITVINFGKKVAEGPPEEILRNEEVIRIYLGKGH